MAQYKAGLTVGIDSDAAKRQMGEIEREISSAEQRSAKAVAAATEIETGGKKGIGTAGAAVVGGVAGAAGSAAAGGVKSLLALGLKFAPILTQLIAQIPMIGKGIATVVNSLDSFANKYESVAEKTIERHAKVLQMTDSVKKALKEAGVNVGNYMDELTKGLIDSKQAMQNLYDVEQKKLRKSTLMDMLDGMSQKALKKSNESNDEYTDRVKKMITPQYQLFLRQQEGRRAIQSVLAEDVRERTKQMGHADIDSAIGRTVSEFTKGN